jgi:hypothetical protein
MRIDAIETRITLHHCPRGTVGRVCALRLRRAFQYTNWRHLLRKGPLVEWISGYSTAVHFHNGHNEDNIWKKSRYTKNQFASSLYIKDRPVKMSKGIFCTNIVPRVRKWQS